MSRIEEFMEITRQAVRRAIQKRMDAGMSRRDAARDCCASIMKAGRQRRHRDYDQGQGTRHQPIQEPTG